MDTPWMDLKEAARMFGMTVKGVRSAIQAERFPVPTYRLGRRLVVDRQVVERFFAERQAEGFRALQERK